MDTQNQLEKTLQSQQGISNLEHQDKVVNLVFSKTPVLTHYSDNLTIGDTWGLPSIKSLCKSKGNDYAGVCITAILTEFLSFTKNSLKAGDVPLYADKILSFLPDWSTSDLVLCLKNGMSGKYGINEYPWQWSPDFIKWVNEYNSEKYNFSVSRHEEKKKSGAKEDQEIINLFPKHILEKFKKETLVDKKYEEKMNFKIPDDIIAQGVDAVDNYIANIKSKLK